MSGPQRIQLSRAKGWRMPENTVKVDRSTPFGNPFFSHPDMPRSRAFEVMNFRDWMVEVLGATRLGSPDVRDLRAFIQSMSSAADPAALRARGERLKAALPLLRGKNLACWCPPTESCHADVLLELANAPTPPTSHGPVSEVGL